MKASNNQKLLIVDNEPTINETLGMIFRKRGYQVFSAHKGDEALKLLKEVTPDFAILDVALPDMSGIEIAIWIQAQLPNCKFLLYSGNQGTIDAMEEAKSRGHEFDVIAKPVPPLELIEAVARLSDSRGPTSPE